MGADLELAERDGESFYHLSRRASPELREGIAQSPQPVAGSVGADRVRDAVGIRDEDAVGLEFDGGVLPADVGEAAEQRSMLADAVDAARADMQRQRVPAGGQQRAILEQPQTQRGADRAGALLLENAVD